MVQLPLLVFPSDSPPPPASVARPELNFYFALRPDVRLRPHLRQLARRLQDTHEANGLQLEEDYFHLSLLVLDLPPSPPDGLLEQALRAARTVNVPSFTLSLAHVMAFGKKRPFHWVLSCQQVPQALVRLRTRLRLRLAEAGLSAASPRAFTPHITLLRNADRSLTPQEIAPFTWHADHFVLVKTVRTPFSFHDLARIDLPESHE